MRIDRGVGIRHTGMKNSIDNHYHFIILCLRPFPSLFALRDN